MKHALTLLIAITAALAGLVASSAGSSADKSRALPSFEMKDLEENTVSTNDERFKDKKLLLVAFGTWQQVSFDQADAVEQFHKKHPEVEIIAFVVDSPERAREFRASRGLTFPCYKPDGGPRIDTGFRHLFDVRESRQLNMNRLPWVLFTGADHEIRFDHLGLVGLEQLEEEYAKIK